MDVLVVRVGGLTPPVVGQAAPTTRWKPFSEADYFSARGAYVTHGSLCRFAHAVLVFFLTLSFLTRITFFSLFLLAVVIDLA